MNDLIRSNLLAGLALATTAFSSPAAEAGNLRCMGPILNFAMERFEAARVRGIVAENNMNQMVNLGTNISVNHVEIRDIHKDAYAIRIYLDSVNDHVTDEVLKTTVYGVDYETCRVRDEAAQLEPNYRVFVDRN